MLLTRISLASALLLCAGAQAATINTNMTVNATGSISTTSGTLTATGTATLTNIGSGTFSGSLSLSGITGQSATAPFTITLSGGGGTITGTLSVPATLLLGTTTSGTGSATVTGGTGPYAGATGSFPNVNGLASGSILTGFTLTFTGAGQVITTGGGGPIGTPTPTISDVLDAGSYTRNIAQGSIFVVKGSNLSANGLQQMSFPLPTASTDGVKITFTPAAGGAGTDAYLVYTYNQGGVNQLAGILPSNVATGNYNVTVTSGGATSAPFSAMVVQRKAGLLTQDSSGSGLVVVQNYPSATPEVNRFTTGSIAGTPISPAKPGQVLVAWATGLGPVTGGDNTASPGFDFAANGVTVRVLVGGVSITPVYAGRAPGLAGADQINFVLPASVPTGCTVPFQLSVNGVLSNPTFVAIAPDAASRTCVAAGFTTAQLENFDRGGTYTMGYFGLSQITQTVPQFGTVKFNSASGTFIQYNGFQLASGSEQAAGLTASGSCQVTQSTSGQGATGSSVNYTTLDAGTVTLNGPAASGISNRPFMKSTVTLPSTGKSVITYSLTLASEGLPAIPGVPAETGTIVGGTYTLSGAGGRDVGTFNTQLTLGSPLTITGGLPATVNRGAGLTLNWTGGNATDFVQISGSSSTRTGSGSSAVTNTTSFSCLTTAGPGTFTVPSSILNQLPPITASATTGDGGFLLVASSPNPTTGNGLFTAPLTAGGSTDYGMFIALVGIGNTVSYQ